VWFTLDAAAPAAGTGSTALGAGATPAAQPPAPTRERGHTPRPRRAPAQASARSPRGPRCDDRSQRGGRNRRRRAPHPCLPARLGVVCSRNHRWARAVSGRRARGIKEQGLDASRTLPPPSAAATRVGTCSRLRGRAPSLSLTPEDMSAERTTVPRTCDRRNPGRSARSDRRHGGDVTVSLLVPASRPHRSEHGAGGEGAETHASRGAPAPPPDLHLAP
jgi:hypothetical protein